MRSAKHVGVFVFLIVTLACSRNSLPLVMQPDVERSSPYVAILISGDGGWARLDKEIAHRLAQQGVPTLGLNSLRYFWSARTREEIALTLEAMLEKAESTWPGRHFLLIGFSRGANVLPFMLEGLPENLRSRVARIALLSPAHSTHFEFRLRDWFTNRAPAGGQPLLPALEKIQGKKLLCLYGKQDPDTVCPELENSTAKVVAFPGGHHLGEEYTEITREILTGLPGLPHRQTGTAETTDSFRSSP